MTNLTAEKDEHLVELTLQGDQNAYEELVIRHEDAVIGTAYKVTGNRFSAEDAAQDAFVSAWMHLNTLRQQEKFGSWVCTIAKNRARRLIVQYRAAIPELSMQLFENGDFAEPFADESARELREAVDSLGDPVRQVMMLHYFDGYTVKEIAKMLSLPEGTVKWRLSEGRKQLRKGYGIMEDRYDEKEALVMRVMRQVEQLKLWWLKNNKAGFEEEYLALLALIDGMEESKEKNHALADVLRMGWWWLPGEKKDGIVWRIREAAEKWHNEDVMETVIGSEIARCDTPEEKIQNYREVQIPYLEKLDFQKTLGHAYIDMGVEQWMSLGLNGDDAAIEESLAAFQKAKEILQPSDLYDSYASAVIEAHAKQREHSDTFIISAAAEEYRLIDRKWRYWTDSAILAAFAVKNKVVELDPTTLTRFISHFDNLLTDSSIQPGESRLSEDAALLLVCNAVKKSVKTPAGIFENCIEWSIEGEHDDRPLQMKITYCPGVGIVRQEVTDYWGKKLDWQLSSYTVENAGQELFPMRVGNRWEYALASHEYGIPLEIVNRYEITYCDHGKAILKNILFVDAV